MLHSLLLSRLVPLQPRNPIHLLGNKIPAPPQSVLPVFLHHTSLPLCPFYTVHLKFCTPVDLFSPEHLLWHQFLHSVHNIELYPTHFPVFIFCVLLFPVTIILVFFIYIFFYIYIFLYIYHHHSSFSFKVSFSLLQRLDSRWSPTTHSIHYQLLHVYEYIYINTHTHIHKYIIRITVVNLKLSFKRPHALAVANLPSRIVQTCGREYLYWNI